MSARLVSDYEDDGMFLDAVHEAVAEAAPTGYGEPWTENDWFFVFEDGKTVKRSPFVLLTEEDRTSAFCCDLYSDRERSLGQRDKMFSRATEIASQLKEPSELYALLGPYAEFFKRKWFEEFCDNVVGEVLWTRAVHQAFRIADDMFANPHKLAVLISSECAAEIITEELVDQCVHKCRIVRCSINLDASYSSEAIELGERAWDYLQSRYEISATKRMERV